MDPQTISPEEAAIIRQYGGTPTSSGPPMSPEEAAIVRQYRGVPTPRTEAQAIQERFAKKMAPAPASPDTFAGQYEAGINPGVTDLAAGLVTHPIDTVKGVLGSLTGAEGVPAFERDLQAIWTQPGARYENILSAIQHAAGMLPLGIGTAINRTGDILRDTSKPLSEELPPALGSAAALVTNLGLVKGGETATAAHAAGAPARAAAIQAAKMRTYVRLMQQAFPDMDAAHIQTTIPAMAAEHAATPIATVTDLIAAKDRAIGKIETHVQAAVDQFPQEIVQVPIRQIEDALDRGLGGPTPGAPPVRGMGTRATDIDKGMQAIESLGLDQPMSLPDMYDRVLRLNSELRKALSESKYDVNAMRQSDPVFRALELAADHARNAVYDRLDQLGVTDIRKLRADEGALIETRGAAYAKRLAGDTGVRPPGGSTLGQQIVAKLIKMAGTGAGAVAGSIFGVPGELAGAVGGGELTEAVANRLRRGPQPRNVVVERAARNLEGLPGMTFAQPLGPLPTVAVMPPGGPGGPPAGPGLPAPPPPPPPPGLPPGTGIGPANWRPGPLPTVTVLPNVQPALPAPAVEPTPLGLPPRPTGLLDLPPPAYPQLGPAPTPAPPRFGRPTPDQPLPTTWEEVARFHGSDAADPRGTAQLPSTIAELLSLPPEERAAAIAELERTTPPAEPPAPRSTPPPTGGEPPAGTAPPAPASPAPPAAPTKTVTPGVLSLRGLVDTLGRENVEALLGEWNGAELSPDGTSMRVAPDQRGGSSATARVSFKDFRDWLTSPEPGSYAPENAEWQQLVADAQAAVAPAARPVSPSAAVPKSAVVPAAEDLVGQLRGSLMKTGVSDVPVATWHERFAAASPEALQTLASWLRGPNSSSWTTKVLLPEVNRLLKGDQPVLPGAEAVRSQEVPQPQFDVPAQGFDLTASEETQPTQPGITEIDPFANLDPRLRLVEGPSAPAPGVTEAPRRGPSLVTQLRTSLTRKNGQLNRPAEHWQAVFRTATLPDLQAAADWVRTSPVIKNVQVRDSLLRDLGEAMNELRGPASVAELEIPDGVRAQGSAPGVSPSDPTAAAGTPTRRAVRGRGQKRVPATGVTQIPPPLRPYFDRLLEDARAQDFQGTPDELASEYLRKVEQAKDGIAEHLNAEAEGGADPLALLKAISAEGGFNMAREGRGGFVGELRHMMESLGKVRRIKSGARAGERLPAPAGGVKGAPGIVRMQGGLPVDQVLQALEQYPEFQGRWDNVGDFLEAVQRAIFEVNNPEAAKATIPAVEIETALAHALDVRPGEKWWTPF